MSKTEELAHLMWCFGEYWEWSLWGAVGLGVVRCIGAAGPGW